MKTYKAEIQKINKLIPRKTKAENATASILLCAKTNPNITPESLHDELVRGDMDAWTGMETIRVCTFSEWSAAMEGAITALRAKV